MIRKRKKGPQQTTMDKFLNDTSLRGASAGPLGGIPEEGTGILGDEQHHGCYWP